MESLERVIYRESKRNWWEEMKKVRNGRGQKGKCKGKDFLEEECILRVHVV